jgi:hypothetical protein
VILGVGIGGGVITYLGGAIGGGVWGFGEGFYPIRLGLLTGKGFGFWGAGIVLLG